MLDKLIGVYEKVRFGNHVLTYVYNVPKQEFN